MPTHLRSLVPVVGLVWILGAPQDARTQADPSNFLFNSGQTVGPIFEGWSRNPDGSYEMHFGYINRNYVEEVHIPIGPNNRFTPAAPDRGQPTFFYPRVNHRLFSVTIPGDWGDKELVWHLTVRDQTHRAVGWLQAEWEIADPAGGGPTAGEGEVVNQPPTLVVNAPRTITLPNTLSLAVTVSDDGLPEPPEEGSGGGGRNILPTFERDPDGPTVPVNVPQLQASKRPRPSRVPIDRVTTTWTVWRGPVSVAVESDGEAQDGNAPMTATFTKPGEYLLRVRASDGRLTTVQDITVTVNGPC